MTTSAPQYVSHRVSSVDGSSSHTSSSSPPFWYPLSHLSRWSGVVAPDAEPAVVKKFMAVAMKALESKYHAQGKESVMRKINNVLCVSEEGFVASVDAWAQVCPTNNTLLQFKQHLPQITQQVFHNSSEDSLTSDDPSSSHLASPSSAIIAATTSSAPPFTLPESLLTNLRAKYAFDSAGVTGSSGVGRLPQASLAAPSNQFSLGAFLDQHLQLSSSTSGSKSAAAGSASAAASHSLHQVRSDLMQLQRAVNQQLSVCKVQNPPKVREESDRVQVYSNRLQSLSSAHAHILRQFESHLTASKPLHEMVERLSANMAFIQRVQLYETLVRQALEWSEKCRDALTAHSTLDAPGQLSPASDKAGPNGGFAAGFNSKDASSNAAGLTGNNDMNLSASNLDAKQLQVVCSMFLKLLRIYQGLQQSTLNFPPASAGNDAQQQQQQQQQWKGVENLQRALRTRIQSLLTPLRKRMIALYQHTLTSLHWPQTNTSLLLGINGTGALDRRSQKGAARADGVDATAIDKTGINASPSSASPPATNSSPSPASIAAASSIDSTLTLFELLTENLVRLQMLMVECGLDEENHVVEREIQGWRNLETNTSKTKQNKGARLWVLTLLLQPIYKRFYFHFDASNPTAVNDPTSIGAASATGAVDLSSSSNAAAAGADPSLTQNSLTNRLDKPEWVCTFLEKTYRDHYEFLDRIIQPIVNRCKFTNAYERDWSEWSVDSTHHTAAASQNTEEEKEQETTEKEASEEDEKKAEEKVEGPGVKFTRQELLLRSSAMDVYEFSMEFLERLLSFYHAKLNRPSTLNILLSSPGLLRHTLHELVNFETKLNQVYNYPIHSSRRLSLLDPFLKSDDNFAVVLRLEKERINRSLEELRTLPHPWEPLLEQKLKKSPSSVEGDSDSEVDEEEQEDSDSMAATAPAFEETGSDENAHFLSTSLTSATSASSLCATVSAHSFLSLIDSLSARSRSFKYLNIRLQILKEIQFKLFEIYEEDFIRTSQENWKKLLENVAASSKKQNGVGGLNSLRILTKNNRSILVAPKGSSMSDSNPLQLWQTHCGLLNSIEYIVSILREWNDDFLYLELYYFYTHKAKIQQSMLAAYQASKAQRGNAATLPPGAATPIGGYYVLHHDGEEEVYITSEELALWIAQGGQVPLDSLAYKSEVAEQKSTAATAANTGSSAGSPIASTFIDSSKPYLPPHFQQTLDQLSSLSTLVGSGNNVAAKSSPRESSEPLLTSPLASSNSAYSPPTSDTLFPKSTLEARESAAIARASKLQAAAASALPMDLSIQGTLFSPILAGYNSLGDDMMHSLVNVVVNHFRDGIRKSQYTAQGHMNRDHSSESHAAAFMHPALDEFFAHDRDEHTPSSSTDSTPFDYRTEHVDSLDWDLLDHHIDISQGLCQPLLDLKMQLIVVHQSLTKSLHRAFCSSVMNKLNQILFDDLVVGQYFTRNGSLQFLRDMRAIFTIFRVYYPMATTQTATVGNERSTTFRLVQDTMNLLVLSPRARQYLISELKSGSLASATPSIVKQALLQPPFYITRMNPDQVVSVLEHMRVDARRKQSQPELELHHQPHEEQDEEDEDEEEAQDEEVAAEEDYADESPRYDEQDDEEADAEVEALASDDADGPQDSAEAVAYEEGDKIADTVHDDEIADELAEASPEQSPEEAAQVDDADADAAEEEEVEEPNLDDFEGFPEEKAAESQPDEEGESVVLQ